MKISLDAKRAYHNSRGLGNYSRDTIRLLTTFAPENEYYLIGKPSAKYSFGGTTTVAPHGIYRHCPTMFRSFGCVADLRGMDVYMGLSGELPFGIHRVDALRKIVTIHDAIFIRYPELYSATYRYVFTQKVKYACHVADKIIAISEQTKRDVVRFFGVDEKKIEVVYQGCNNIFREKVTDEALKELSSYGLPSEYILNVGAIEPRKNLENLIKAVGVSGCGLPIVAVGGRSKYAEQMRMLAEETGVSLTMLHGFPFRLFPAVYSKAMMFAYPSVFEGFGIPILEAMCVGTPVLTSTGSCFAETGGEACVYANPLSVEEIAEGVKRIAEDENMRRKMVAKGYEQAAKFTDEKVAKALVKVIKCV